jgi:hypothetical protein
MYLFFVIDQLNFVIKPPANQRLSCQRAGQPEPACLPSGSERQTFS